MRVFVIADLHLSVDTPELLDKFRAFADEISVEDELYILGDLFNYYVGINPDDKVHAAVREINSSIISRGGKVYFIHGNRDFLLNNRDASYFKIQLLKDISTVEINGSVIAMVHGDELCDESLGYRFFRWFSRCGFMQWLFNVCTSYSYRVEIAMNMRDRSIRNFAAANFVKRMINTDKAVKLMKKIRADVLIHGHTHNAEEVMIDNQYLIMDTGDWNQRGFSYIKIEYDKVNPENRPSITIEKRNF